MVRTVEPDDLSQHVRVARIRLRTRRAVPVAVARGLDRVDRPHLVAGRQQRLHPRPPVGLDPDQHLIRLVVVAEMITDQAVQVGDPGHPFGESAAGKHLPVPVLQLDVVMGLSPVIPKEQHPPSPPSNRQSGASSM